MAVRAGDRPANFGLQVVRVSYDDDDGRGPRRSIVWFNATTNQTVPPNHNRKSFGRKIYKALLAISLILAVNYSLMAVYLNSIIVSDAPDAPYAFPLSLVWRGLVFLNVLPIVLQEAWQCRTQGLGHYIRDVWNVLDLVMLSLVFASLGVSFVLPRAHRYFYLLSGARNKWTGPWMSDRLRGPRLNHPHQTLNIHLNNTAFACLLLWFKLLAYLRGFRHTGPLVSIMAQIVIDMRFFLFVSRPFACCKWYMDMIVTLTPAQSLFGDRCWASAWWASASASSFSSRWT